MPHDELKRLVGRHAAGLVEEGMVVGLGTGSTARHFVDRLGERVAEGLRIRGIPTSERTAAQAHALGIPLVSLRECPIVDLAVDGCDQFDPAGNLIKGLGGRPRLRTAGDAPYITDNGNWILDVDFGPIEDPAALDGRLDRIEGLVENGLFPGMADRILVGESDGVREWRPPRPA